MKKNKYEEYDFLLPLIGVDINVAMAVFKPYVNFKIRGYNKKFGGFPEELVAFSKDIAMARPKTKKGPDFGKLGDCKAVQVKRMTDRLNVNQVKNLMDLNINSKTDDITKIRNSGNPPIARLENCKFFNSNIWAKIKKLILVYHEADIITDIRIFDGLKYDDVLNDDYEFIKNNKNEDSKIITLKKKTGSVQIKKNMDAFLSESIVPKNLDNKIIDQISYIETIFSEKLKFYKENNVEEQEKIVNFVNNTANPSQLIEFAERIAKSNKLSPSQLTDIVEIFKKSIKASEFVDSRDDDLAF